jgi:hypothetical protein
MDRVEEENLLLALGRRVTEPTYSAVLFGPFQPGMGWPDGCERSGMRPIFNRLMTSTSGMESGLPKGRSGRYLDGCPNSKIAVERVQHALHEIGKREVDLGLHVIATHEDAESFLFTGAPTILINGRDPLRRCRP